MSPVQIDCTRIGRCAVAAGSREGNPIACIVIAIRQTEKHMRVGKVGETILGMWLIHDEV